MRAQDRLSLIHISKQLHAIPEIEICSCVADESALGGEMEKRKPDVVLMDLVQPTPQNQSLLYTYQKMKHRPPILFYGFAQIPIEGAAPLVGVWAAMVLLPSV